jgi:streptogramin lyase
VNQEPMSTDLPPAAARFLDRVRSLEPPVDLVDRIRDAVDATPQQRGFLAGLPRFSVPRPAVLAAVAAAALLIAALLLRLGPLQVGPPVSPSPVPIDRLPSAGQMVARWAVGAGDQVAVVAHGYVWLENADRGSLSRFDPATGTASEPVDITRGFASSLTPTADATSVWVLDTNRNALVEIEPGSMAELRRIPLHGFGRDVAVANGIAWVTSSEFNGLLRVDLATEKVERVPMALQAPHSVLFDGQWLWVGTEVGTLARLDPATGAVQFQVQTGAVAFDMARVSDVIVVYGGALGTISLDATTGDVVARTAGFGTPIVNPTPLNGFGAPASGEDRLWAPKDTAVVELDAHTLRPIASLDLGLTGIVVVYGDGALWASGTDASGNTMLVQIQPTP